MDAPHAHTHTHTIDLLDLDRHLFCDAWLSGQAANVRDSSTVYIELYMAEQATEPMVCTACTSSHMIPFSSPLL